MELTELRASRPVLPVAGVCVLTLLVIALGATSSSSPSGSPAPAPVHASLTWNSSLGDVIPTVTAAWNETHDFTKVTARALRDTASSVPSAPRPVMPRVVPMSSAASGAVAFAAEGPERLVLVSGSGGVWTCLAVHGESNGGTTYSFGTAERLADVSTFSACAARSNHVVGSAF